MNIVTSVMLPTAYDTNVFSPHLPHTQNTVKLQLSESVVGLEPIQ